MTEIVVIKRLDDISKVSLEERAEGLDIVAKQIKLEDYHVKNLLYMEQQKMEKLPKPDILSLLIRNICKWNHIIPIVKLKTAQTVEELSQEFNFEIRGGDDQNIVQFINNKECLNLDDINNINESKLYKIPKETPVDVHGLVVLPISRINKSMYSWMPRSIEQLFMGNFQPNDIAYSLLQPIYNLTSQNLNLPTKLGGKVSKTPKSKTIKTKALTKSKDQDHVKSQDTIIMLSDVNAEQNINILFEYQNYLDQTTYNDYIYTLLNVLDSDLDLDKTSELYSYLSSLCEIGESPLVKDLYDIPEWTPQTQLVKFLENVPFEFYPSYVFESSSRNDIHSLGLNLIYSQLILKHELGSELNKLQSQAEMSEVEKSRYLTKIDKEHNIAMMENISQVKFLKSLEKLNDKEINIVKNDFTRQIKRKEAWRNNKCPHIPLEHKMRTTENQEDKLFNFKQLGSYTPNNDKKLSNGTPVSMIECSNCHYELICPHIRDLMILKLRNTSGDDTRKHLFKYAGEVPINDAYYCSICSEVLTYNLDMEGINMFSQGERIERHNAEDELLDYIRKATMYIVNNHVIFSGLQSKKFIRGFVDSLVNAIYEPIYYQQKIINKTKTATATEVENRMQLFTDIYIFALIIKIYKDNPKAFILKGLIVGKKSKKVPPLQEIFSVAYNIIILTRNILISNLNLDNDIVERSLYKAYKVINQIVSKSKISSEDTEVIESLNLDPIYSYYVKMRVLSKSGDLKKLYWQESNIRTSLGIGLNELKNMDFIYNRAKSPFTDSVGHTYEDYYKSSFSTFLDYLKNTTGKHVFRSGGYFKDKIYYKTLDYEPEFIKYFAIQDKLALTEKDISNAEKISLRRAFWKFDIAYQINTPSDPHMLSQRYGVEILGGRDLFHEHKWNIFHYGKLKLKVGDLLNISAEKQKDMELTAIECSICHYTKQQVSKNIDPLNMMEEVENIKNFYNYYTYRCPVGIDSLHEFDTNICKKCKFQDEYKLEQNRSYYNKYKSVFKSRSEETTSLVASKFLTHVDVKKSYASYYSELNKDSSYVNWKFNPNIIMTFSNTTYDLVQKELKIKKPNYLNILLNLGLTEGVDFDDIIGGSETPYKNIEIDDALSLRRIARLENYIHELIVDQTILRNYDSVSEISPELRDIIKPIRNYLSKNSKNIGMYKGKYASEDYFGALENMKKQFYMPGQYYKIANFILDSLFKLILRLNEEKPLKMFIIYSILKIINNEQAVGKLKAKKSAEVLANVGTERALDMVDRIGDSTLDGLVTEEDLEKSLWSEIDYEGDNEDF
jgi:hypothetical protein